MNPTEKRHREEYLEETLFFFGSDINTAPFVSALDSLFPAFLHDFAHRRFHAPSALACCPSNP